MAESELPQYEAPVLQGVQAAGHEAGDGPLHQSGSRRRTRRRRHLRRRHPAYLTIQPVLHSPAPMAAARLHVQRMLSRPTALIRSCITVLFVIRFVAAQLHDM